MSQRHWMHFIAAGCLAVLYCGGAPAQQPVAEPREKSGGAASDKSTADKQDPTAILAPILKGIEAAIRESKAEEDKAERQSQRDREAADLKAQQDMALWAKWMFVANAATVLLTFAALIAILRTLHHTRRAADSSEVMVREAASTTKAAITSADAALATVIESKRAADASAEAVVVARESLIAQQRPWLIIAFKIEKVEYVRAMIDMVVSVEIRNVGNSPAFASPIGGSFRQEGDTSKTRRSPDYIEEASMFAGALIDKTTITIVHGERNTQTMRVREPDMLGMSVAIAIAVQYRMAGHDRVFESLCAGTVKLTDSMPNGLRRAGIYEGRVETDLSIQSYLT